MLLASTLTTVAFIAFGLTDFVRTLRFGGIPVHIERDVHVLVEYDPKDETPTTLIFLKGSSTAALDTIATITDRAIGGYICWKVPHNLSNGDDYVWELQQEDVDPKFAWGISVIDGNDDSPIPECLTSSLTSLSATTPSTLSSPSSSNLITASSRASTTSITESSSSDSPTSTPTHPFSSSLSTGAKAGIGSGVSIVGLCLALGAIFLGMSIRKKSKMGQDNECGTDNGKPELDGKEVHKHEVYAEMDSDGQVQELPAMEGNTEIEGSTLSPPSGGLKSHNYALSAEIGSRSGEPIPQATAHIETEGHRLVSPVEETKNPTMRRQNTYDDPQLTQNPWAQDEVEMQK